MASPEEEFVNSASLNQIAEASELQTPVASQETVKELTVENVPEVQEDAQDTEMVPTIPEVEIMEEPAFVTIIEDNPEEFVGGADLATKEEIAVVQGAAAPSTVTVTAPAEESEEFLTPAQQKERYRELRKKRISERSKISGSSVIFDDLVDNDTDGDNKSREDSDDTKSIDKQKYLLEHVNEYRPRHKRIMDEDYEDSIMKMLDDDDDDDVYGIWSPESMASLYEHPSDDTIQMKTDFLQNFAVPQLSDVSEEDIRAIQARKNLSGMIQDIGKFVDPLTGEMLPSPKNTDEPTESEDRKGENLEEASQSSESEELSDFSIDEDTTSNTDDPRRVKYTFVEDNTQEAFTEFHRTYINKETLQEEKKPENLKLKQELVLLVSDFLDDLFDEIVDKSEWVHADDRLRGQCDKAKLIEALHQSIDSYFDEKAVNSYVNARTVEYYKRQRKTRVFAELPPMIEYRERRRYLELLNYVDWLRNRASVSKRKNSDLMASVLMDMNHVENLCQHSESVLEKKVKQYLNPGNSEYLKRVIDREMKLMYHKRNEISDVRLFLITRKHAFGRISEKIKKLERVTDTLSMNDFIAIQNQVVSLDKKLEERNNELKKLLNNYYSEIHQTQHDIEKSSILSEQLEEKKTILRDKLERQSALRERLYEEKMYRTRLSQRQKELSFKGGILSMPALMHDYDETVDTLEKRRVCIDKLKEKLRNMSGRIAFYEARRL